MNYWDYRARRLELKLAACPPQPQGHGQKFWAYLMLLLSILALAGISILVSAMEKDGTTTDPTVLQAKLAILNMAMGGFIGGFGAACQAFFRTSQTDQDTAAAMKSMADSLPAAPVLPSGGTTTTTTTVEPTPENGAPVGPAGTETDPFIVAGAPEGTPAVRTKPEKKS